MPHISILRIGHRVHRDHRISTHCCLVARVFGANEIIYTGQKDSGMEATINRINDRWGNSFTIKHAKSYKQVIKKWKGFIIHLTMYGLPFHKNMRKIPKNKNILIIVGGEKVPREVYRMVDMNIAVTNQPHSEIAALALFLDKHFKGKELDKKFRKAKLKIVPQERGKKILGN